MARLCCSCVAGLILGLLVVPLTALVVLEFTDCDVFGTDS